MIIAEPTTSVQTHPKLSDQHQHDEEEYRKNFERMVGIVTPWFSELIQPDQIVELRALKVQDEQRGFSTWAGTFRGSELTELVEAALRISGLCSGVYYTLNPLKPERFVRQAPRLQRMQPGQLTHDRDILERRWLLVDIDPVKPQDFLKESATAEEKAKTYGLAIRVRDYLTAEGWPQPILCDSGNGHHLLYRLAEPYPVDPGTLPLGESDPLRRVLLHLGEKFNGTDGEIDAKVFNPARIVKFPGTLACKGTNTPERPYRRAKVLEIPRAQGRVFTELILQIAERAALRTSAAAVGAEKSANTHTSGFTKLTPRLERRIVRYVAKRDPSIDGDYGSDECLITARILIDGYALSRSDAIHLFKLHFNPKCQPPWSDREIEHKFDAVQATPCTKPRGHLLGKKGIQVYREKSSNLPTIVIGTDQYRVNDEVIRALALDAELYQRGGSLVRVIDSESSQIKVAKAASVNRVSGPSIRPVSIATLRERLTAVARLVTIKESEYGPYEKEEHPPDWCVQAVRDRGSWEGVRSLDGVTEFPIVRSDGSVCRDPGFDKDTGVFVGSGTWVGALDLIANPTQADAESCARELLEVIVDFPFADEQSKSAWVAALLTPLSRYAFFGPTPITMVDANVPGVGKGKLVNSISRILIGHNAATALYTQDAEEMRKVITSVAMSGDRLILLDNVSGGFGGKALDPLLTSDLWKDRLLGTNINVEIALRTCWFATANNVSYAGDMFRRVMMVRLHSTLESPEERAGFIHPDLIGWIDENRNRLLRDALTILSAFIRAGCPSQNLTPFGSFEGWNRVVRGAVVWSGLTDPIGDRVRVRQNQEGREPMLCILRSWSEFSDHDNCCTVSQIIDYAWKSESATARSVREAILKLVRKKDNDGKADATSLGKVFGNWKERTVEGVRLIAGTKLHGYGRWKVEMVLGGVVTSSGVTTPQVAGHNTDFAPKQTTISFLPGGGETPPHITTPPGIQTTVRASPLKEDLSLD